MNNDTSNNPTLKQVHENYHLLESADFVIPNNIRLISNVRFSEKNEISVRYIAPNFFIRLFRRLPLFFSFFHALQIFFSADSQTIILIDGSDKAVWLFTGCLNRIFFFRKRTLFLWDIFVEYILGTEKKIKIFPFLKFKTKWKEYLARNALLSYDLLVQWSKKQVSSHADYYRLPEEKLFFLPFKSNHSNSSKLRQYDLHVGKFVFSGGNGKRDYKCLVDAVKGTDIPVIISATDPDVRKTIEYLPNVIVLGAPEPAFAQLQAASQFVVIPMIHSGLKGGGETNVCNAMWHSKPVIACCNMAAEDYIIEGETGFVIPSGDSELLRRRILELWNDPERVAEMGKKAHAHVKKNFTHDLLTLRLLRLAMILGDEKNSRNSTQGD
ncbi:MAG: glycosyltransferase [Planctomycetaceae bacterium]|jgi:glycosyltransferase involved in cell wall biosynthesis|nr:glycosyltransferase [Planctomycetaceae bacterium]